MDYVTVFLRPEANSHPCLLLSVPGQVGLPDSWFSWYPQKVLVASSTRPPWGVFGVGSKRRRMTIPLDVSPAFSFAPWPQTRS